MKTMFILIALLVTTAVAEDSPKKTIDMVYIVPNGFEGPIFVDPGRLVLPEVSERQKNTYTVVIVDRDGEAVQFGSFDTVPGWHYRYTVIQRNGLRIKTEGSADHDIAFRPIGGYGAWKRAYRPGGFAAYFIGTKSKAENFRHELEQLVHAPVSKKEEQSPAGDAKEGVSEE